MKKNVLKEFQLKLDEISKGTFFVRLVKNELVGYIIPKYDGHMKPCAFVKSNENELLGQIHFADGAVYTNNDGKLCSASWLKDVKGFTQDDFNNFYGIK